MKTIKEFFLKRIVEMLTFDPLFSYYRPLQNRRDTNIIVALGDSITAGFEVRPEERYTSLLAQHVEAHDYTIIAQGVSGDTTIDGLARLPAALDLAPEILILELGGNDFIKGYPIAEVEARLTEIITTAQKQSTEVLLVGLLAVDLYGLQYVWASRQMFRRLARRHGLMFMPHIMRKTLLRPHLMMSDRIHPKPAGYRLIAQQMWPYLRRMLHG